MNPANKEVVEGCLVLIIGAEFNHINVGKVATASRKVYHGDTTTLGGVAVSINAEKYRSKWGWLLEGESLVGTINTSRPYDEKGWTLVQPHNIIPIYPEEDDQYLEELAKESEKCKA